MNVKSRAKKREYSHRIKRKIRTHYTIFKKEVNITNATGSKYSLISFII